MRDDWVHKLLRGIELFAPLEDPALARLAEGAESLHLPGGETLLREGDRADALYVVASGRMQAFVAAEGTETLVGEIGRGEVIGEMGILGDEPRSATVRALRDSNLLRFSSDMFVGFLHEHPEELFAITRLIIQRLRRSIRSDAGSVSVRTIAVVPLGGSDGATFARFLTSMFRERTTAHLVGPGDVDESLTDGEQTRRMHELEDAHDLLVYLADGEPSGWTERCLRQADRVVLVADADGDTAITEVERRLLGADGRQGRARVDLVLVQPDHRSDPKHAVQWLGGRRVQRHHHVRLGWRDDLQRVARALTGREIALVLSGGGARGMAHVGIFRALQELGIPVDVVGGSSFGSIAGGYIAAGFSWEEQRESLWENLSSKGSVVDLTAPAVSLSKGQRVTEAIRAGFGDRLIENLWLPYFCLSSNLSRGEVTVHDRGSVWQAMRASVSIPGLWPPVRSGEGDILVDGGVMNNLPVDVMETFYDGGAIIAVNLKGTSSLPSVGLSDTGVMSGWGPMARRFNPLTESVELPGIVDVLLRSTETGNVLAAKRMEREADVVLHPDVAQFSLLAFEELDPVIEAGYRYAIKALPAHEDLLKRLL
ncbi:MAG: cyclic nucleotide-binding domain-containing protein [Acidimicrobiia bacterium]|nr:cyclic nucleotide-binding domain-containing protein [Acidimicrobiia bacterium]